MAMALNIGNVGMRMIRLATQRQRFWALCNAALRVPALPVPALRVPALTVPALTVSVSLLSLAGGVQAVRAQTLSLTPVAVFGADDRVPLPPRYQKQQDAIGVLFNVKTRSVCTAFCVAEAMIVTAGHCLFRTSGERKPPLADFWFARNYDRLRNYARVAGHATGSAGQHVLAGSGNLKVAPPIDATSDWALVRLAKPACGRAVLDVAPLGIEAIVKAGREQKMFQIAYHKDFTLWQQAYSKPCKVETQFTTTDQKTVTADFSKPEALLLHTCDTGGASSGSPLLIETPTGPKVIGVNVGTYVQSKMVVREGQPVEKLKPETIANTAVAASAFAGRMDAFRTARILANAAGIRDLQERLKAKGHYNGPTDGTYGPGLQQSIEAYETSQQLPATGIASEALLQRLKTAPVVAR
jgi:V8-like Glu-specific endopeptidase